MNRLVEEEELRNVNKPLQNYEMSKVDKILLWNNPKNACEQIFFIIIIETYTSSVRVLATASHRGPVCRKETRSELKCLKGAEDVTERFLHSEVVWSAAFRSDLSSPGLVQRTE